MVKRKDILASPVRMIGNCLLMCGLVVMLLACATKPDAYAAMDDAVAQDNFEAGVEAIIAGQEGKKPVYPEKNVISLYLDKGMLEHYAGKSADSAQSLQEAERLIAEAFTKSVTADIASYVANDNTKEYPGEDFEDIYISMFNALNYYNNGDVEGAMVEIRKLTNQSGKLDMLSRKYEESSKSAGAWMLEQLEKIGFQMNSELPQGEAVNFSNSALARYLAALFYIAEGNEDGARIEFEQLAAAFAEDASRPAENKIYPAAVPAAIEATQTVPAGKARLNVIGFTGLSPIKQEEVFTQNWTGIMKNPALGEVAFKLPVLTDRRSNIDRIEVAVEGGETFELELFEDMGAVMKETFNARFGNLFLKTYIRVLLKYGAGDIAAQAAGDPGSLEAQLAAMGAKKAADASEAADVRMSRYLPDQSYIGGINLDPGTYNVTINFYTGGGVVATQTHSVEVKAGGLNLIEAVSLK